MKSTLLDNDKEKWVSKILADLKKETISYFDYDIVESVSVSPFATIEDISEFQKVNVRADKQHNAWEMIAISDAQASETYNSSLLESLNGGINALKIRYNKELNEVELATIFKDINPEYISLHLAGNMSSVQQTFDLFKKQGFQLANIKGSSSAAKESIWKMTKSHFKTELFAIANNSPQQIADVLHKIFENIRIHADSSISLQDFSERFQLEVKLGSNYVENIALIKALRILWNHLTSTYYLEDSRIKIITENTLPGPEVSAEENYIFASIYALSAACGAADGIIIKTLPNKKFRPEFQKRIGKNLHHLLSLESKTDLVLDPLAGSYFIENAANQIAEKTWKIFSEKISTT